MKIIDRAKVILQEVDAIHEISEATKNPFCGKFKIGAFPTLAPYLFPELVSKIKEKLSDLTLVLVEEKSDVLIDQLKSGVLDVAFLALPIEDEKLESVCLFEDVFQVAVPVGHPLAKNKTITQKSLMKEKLLLLDEGHCLRDQALDLCHRYHIETEQDFRATSLETLRQMVKAGTGITLMPNIAIGRNEEGIVYLPFEKNIPARSIALVWRKTTAKRLLLEEVIQLLK